MWIRGAEITPRAKGEGDLHFLQLKLNNSTLSTACLPSTSPQWHSRFQFSFPVASSPPITFTVRRNSAGWPAAWCTALAEQTFELPQLGVMGPSLSSASSTLTLAPGFLVHITVKWSSPHSRLRQPAHVQAGFPKPIAPPPLHADYCNLCEVDPKAPIVHQGHSVENMLMLDTTAQVYRNWHQHYANDSLVDASQPLPCRQLLHIYGTGIDTEIGSAYRHKSFHTEHFDEEELQGEQVVPKANKSQWKFESDLELDVDATPASLRLPPAKHLKVAGGDRKSVV